jgi:hypothetical protein
MKKTVAGLFVIFSLFTFNNCQAMGRTAYPEQSAWNADARVSYFHETLRPYGEWVWDRTYGWVWSPYHMAADWRPYTDGHWVYTDYGWSWVSDQSWGWACFHYGRWFFDNRQGWLWYPDTVWAPSWVAWRTGGDWIGWAPLPPEAVWHQGRGFEDRDFNREHIPWNSFSFSHAHDFSDPDVRHRLIMPARNAAVFGETRLSANTIALRNGRIENQVPFHNTIEKTAGRPIERLKIASTESPEHNGVAGNELRVFRPEVAAKKEPVASAVSPQSENKRALETQKAQTDHKRTVNEPLGQPSKNPPPDATKAQLAEQPKAKPNATQETATRERQPLQSQQSREVQAPKTLPQRSSTVPVSQVSQSKSNENRSPKSERQINAPVSQAKSKAVSSKDEKDKKESRDGKEDKKESSQ